MVDSGASLEYSWLVLVHVTLMVMCMSSTGTCDAKLGGVCVVVSDYHELLPEDALHFNLIV